MPAKQLTDLDMETRRLKGQQMRDFLDVRNLREWDPRKKAVADKYSSNKYYNDGGRRQLLLMAEQMNNAGNWYDGRGGFTEPAQFQKTQYSQFFGGGQKPDKPFGMGTTKAMRGAEMSLRMNEPVQMQGPAQDPTLPSVTPPSSPNYQSARQRKTLASLR